MGHATKPNFSGHERSAERCSKGLPPPIQDRKKGVVCAKGEGILWFYFPTAQSVRFLSRISRL
jgi:hypothetical protein